MDSYTKSLDRGDLKNWVVHFTKPTVIENVTCEPFDVLRNILLTRKVNASLVEQITRYEPDGAACFYDVPPRQFTSYSYCGVAAAPLYRNTSSL